AVLGSDIVALTHALGGVVVLPEELQHVLVRGLRRVEDHEHGLGVTGARGAYLLVGGVRREPAGVTHRCGVDAGRLPEDTLGTPEAAQAEHGLLQPLRERWLERRAQHGVAIRDGNLLRASR